MVLTLGMPGDTLSAAIDAEGFVMTACAHRRDIDARIDSPIDVRVVLVLENAPIRTGTPLEELLRLHRRRRDISLGYVAFEDDPVIRNQVLRVRARYFTHATGRDLRDAIAALAIPVERVAALVDLATHIYGLGAMDRRLLRLLLRSTPAPHIGELFSVSNNTVKYHLRKLLAKVGAPTTTDAVRRVLSLDA